MGVLSDPQNVWMAECGMPCLWGGRASYVGVQVNWFGSEARAEVDLLASVFVGRA